jgi:GNAT superfamily N-acetyltransferase
MNIEIRTATENDLQDILNLYAQPEMDNGRVLSIADAQKIFNRIKKYPNYSVYVALMNNVIAGTFALLIMDNLAHIGTPSGIVEDVAVCQNNHGKGIGKKMMQFAMQKCKEFGCYKLILSSNVKREKAHQFYESLGFKQHGISFHVDIHF